MNIISENISERFIPVDAMSPITRREIYSITALICIKIVLMGLLLKVGFICWIERVGITLNFVVPFDFYIGGSS